MKTACPVMETLQWCLFSLRRACYRELVVMVASSFQRTEGSLVGKGFSISKAIWRLAIAPFMVDVDASDQCQCTSVCCIYLR